MERNNQDHILQIVVGTSDMMKRLLALISEGRIGVLGNRGTCLKMIGEQETSKILKREQGNKQFLVMDQIR